jgi:hypothetical protein
VHTPKEAHTQVADSVATRAALSAPKKKAEGLAAVHKGDSATAPQKADFHVNDTSGDQSTESVAESSSITYEEHSGDQSTENAPDSSAVTYEEHSADQSTENAPEGSAVTYEEHSADQSTENAPEGSGVTYEEHAADQSTEGYGAGYGEEECKSLGFFPFLVLRLRVLLSFSVLADPIGSFVPIRRRGRRGRIRGGRGGLVISSPFFSYFSKKSGVDRLIGCFYSIKSSEVARNTVVVVV